MSQGKGLIGIVIDAPLLQLKAYYVSHLDQNIHSVLARFGIDNFFNFAFPDWFVPLCALVAALVSTFAITHWLITTSINFLRWTRASLRRRGGILKLTRAFVRPGLAPFIWLFNSVKCKHRHIRRKQRRH